MHKLHAQCAQLRVAFLVIVVCTAQSAVAATNACPYRVVPEFHEPVKTNDTFTLAAIPLNHTLKRPLKIDFGAHDLYTISDTAGGLINGQTTLNPGQLTKFTIELLAGNPGIETLEVDLPSYPECDPKFEFDTGFQSNVNIISRDKSLDREDPPSSVISSGHLSFPIELVRSNSTEQIYPNEPMLLSINLSGPNTDHDAIAIEGIRVPTPQTRIPLPDTAPVITVDDQHWGEPRFLTITIFKSVYPDNGLTLSVSSARVLGTYFFFYRTAYPPLILCLMTILGALGYVAIESLPALNKGSQPPRGWWEFATMDHYSKFGVAIATALLSFFMAYLPLLKAIRLDQSSLISYLIYGFCTSVLGIEAILKKVKQLAG